MPGRICQAAEQASRQAGCSARLLRPGRASYRVTWPQSWNAPFSGVGASRLGMWIARVAGLMEKWSREAWGLASCPPHGALPPPLPSPLCARCLSTPTPCERVGGLSDIQNPAEAGNLTCTSRPAAGARGRRPAACEHRCDFNRGCRGRRADGKSQPRPASRRQVASGAGLGMRPSRGLDRVGEACGSRRAAGGWRSGDVMHGGSQHALPTTARRHALGCQPADAGSPRTPAAGSPRPAGRGRQAAAGFSNRGCCDERAVLPSQMRHALRGHGHLGSWPFD